MSPLAVFAICVQACLIQSVISQNCGCSSNIYNNLGSYSLSGLNTGLFASPTSLGNYGPSSTLNLGNAAFNSVSSASCSTYGGMGTGQVGVAGDVGACGNTVVVGSVPVLGAVDFSGVIPASGSVTISGQCGCGCQ